LDPLTPLPVCEMVSRLADAGSSRRFLQPRAVVRPSVTRPNLLLIFSVSQVFFTPREIFRTHLNTLLGKGWSSVVRIFFGSSLIFFTFILATDSKHAPSSFAPPRLKRFLFPPQTSPPSPAKFFPFSECLDVPSSPSAVPSHFVDKFNYTLSRLPSLSPLRLLGFPQAPGTPFLSLFHPV